jgi:small subunit ribosomal protein S6
MAGPYDLMLLLDPTAPEERRTAAISEAESMIGSGGELIATHDWGQRRMAYEIDHRPEAEYRLYQFDGDNALLDRLNQRLRILDGVLRFRIIKFKPGQPTPPPPDQQAPRRREEREAQDTKVAARAAADAPPHEDEDGSVAAPAAPVATPDAPASGPDAPAAPTDAPDAAPPVPEPAAAPASPEPASTEPTPSEPASQPADE